MRPLGLLLLASAALGACASAPLAPPALFPMETLWVAAPLGAPIDGPLASDGIRVFISTRAAVVALDGAGAPVWRLEGRSGRLAAGPGVLVLRAADGRVTSLDPATGAVRWESDTRIGGDLPPAIDGDHILVAGDGIAALETSTGRTAWSLPGPPRVTAPPAPAGSRLLVGEADGTLRCRDRASGLSLWSFRTASPLQAPAVVDDHGRVLVGTTDGRFLALGIDRGGRRWQWKVGADIVTPAAVVGPNVVFASHEGVLYGLDRAHGDMRWRAPLPSRPLSGPLPIEAGVLVACYERDLLGFDTRSAGRLGGLKTGAELRTPPLRVGDRLYVGLRDNTVVAYQMQMMRVRPAARPSPEPREPRRQP